MRTPSNFSQAVRSVSLACVASTLTLLSVLSPPVMAEKQFDAGDFRGMLKSLRSGTADPKVSDKDLQLQPFSVKSEGISRTYFVHVPQSLNLSKPAPLLLAFHGAGGHARGMPRLTRLNEVADKRGFIVVYPEALNTRWKDGNAGLSADEQEDVMFVKSMLTQINSKFHVDKARIYAAGVSNGGFFSQWLALNMPSTFAAVASIAATIGESISKNMLPAKPISVLFIHGDDDDVVPYMGGAIGVAGAFEEKTPRRCVSATRAADFWAKADGIAAKPSTAKLPDAKPFDGTHVVKTVYSGGKDATEVILITVQNGGHTWPSGWQYLPEEIVGKTSRAINASEEIWAFFQRHPRSSQ